MIIKHPLHLLPILIMAVCCSPLSGQNDFPEVFTAYDLNLKEGLSGYTGVVAYRSPSFTLNDQIFGRDVHIGQLMIQAAVRGDFNLYRDDLLTDQIVPGDPDFPGGGTDTIAVVDPNDYSVTYETITRKLRPEDFSGLRVHLTLDHSTTTGFTQKVISASLQETDDRGQCYGPRYYFRVNTPKAPLEEIVDEFNMVVYSYQALDPDSFRDAGGEPIKQAEVVKSLLQAALTDPTNMLRWQDKGKRYTSVEEDYLKKRFGYKPKAVPGAPAPPPPPPPTPPVSMQKPRGNQPADKIRLLQYLAWDGERNEFSYFPVGYAHLEKQQDENGNILYYSSTYYWLSPAYR